MSTEIHKILTRHWYVSGAVALSASIVVLDSITLATGDYFLGDDIIIRGTWTFQGGDTIDNSVIFGYSTGTSGAIIIQETVNVPKGTGLLPTGSSYGCFSRVIRITGAISAGTTLYFLAQLSVAPVTAAPIVLFEGTVSY
jgi:hypothetical protein